MAEAGLARELGYDAVLLGLGGLGDWTESRLLAHCRRVGDVLPLIGFYLQPAVGGRVLGPGFWRRFAEIPAVVAIKIAPFDRYRTLDVVRAVVEAGRDDIALLTGNDDQIVLDLLTPYAFTAGGRRVPPAHRRRPAGPVGGLDAPRRRDARRGAGRRGGGRRSRDRGSPARRR